MTYYVGEGLNSASNFIGNLLQNQQRQIQNQALPDSLRIANALKQNELNFAPQMSAATLAKEQQMAPYYKALTGETNARIPYIGAETQSLLAGIPKTQTEAEMARMQLQMIKNGQLPISGMGGLGSRYIGGKTFVDPQTGETKSIPSSASTNYLQRASSSINQVQPVLQDLIQGASPYLGFTGNLQQGADLTRNYFGLGSPESLGRQSNYNSSLANMNTTAEMITKAFGLNGTVHNFEAMKAVIQPMKGDTPETYQARIQKEAENLKRREDQYNQILTSGYGTNQYNAQQNPMSIPQARQMQPGMGQGMPAIQQNIQQQPQIQSQKTVRGKNYVMMNGQWYEQ